MIKFDDKVLAFLEKLKKWIRTDGLLHFAISALIVFAFGWVRPTWAAPAIALTFGILKEIYDIAVPEKHTAEWHDIICDVAGITFASLLMFAYR